MKQWRRRLAQRYHAELRNYLRSGLRASSRRAKGLGRKALSEGLETLDLASIHGQALLALMPVNCSSSERDMIVRLAGAFFLDALSPIEKTHRAMVDNVALLKHSNESLRCRTSAVLSVNSSTTEAGGR